MVSLQALVGLPPPAGGWACAECWGSWLWTSGLIKAIHSLTPNVQAERALQPPDWTSAQRSVYLGEAAAQRAAERIRERGGDTVVYTAHIGDWREA